MFHTCASIACPCETVKIIGTNQAAPVAHPAPARAPVSAPATDVGGVDCVVARSAGFSQSGHRLDGHFCQFGQVITVHGRRPAGLGV